jgi:hypothetical protein
MKAIIAPVIPTKMTTTGQNTFRLTFELMAAAHKGGRNSHRFSTTSSLLDMAFIPSTVLGI